MSYLRHRELTDLGPSSWSDWRAYEATGVARGLVGPRAGDARSRVAGALVGAPASGRGAIVVQRPVYPGLGNSGDGIPGGQWIWLASVLGLGAVVFWLAFVAHPWAEKGK